MTGSRTSTYAKRVAEFTLSGAVTYLADLQTGRYGHACSKFIDSNGEIVSLLVLGTIFPENL